MKAYISVTIGRNVGNQPMTLNAWNQFKGKTRRIIHRHGLNTPESGVIFDGDGFGAWGTVSEDSHAFIVLSDSPTIHQLKIELAKLAKLYNQEAIGCAIVPLVNGDETLVMAE